MKHSESLSAWQELHSDAGTSFSGEGIPEATIVIVTQGSMEIVIDGNHLIISKDEQFLLPPGKSYSGVVREAVRVVACRFLPDTLFLQYPVREYVSASEETETEVCKLKTNHILRRFLEQLGLYFTLGIMTDEMQEIKMQEFFFLLFATHRKDILSSLFRPLIDTKDGFHYFIVRNWMKARNVEELAAMSNLSTSGFIKKFKKNFGESPYRWMMHQKAGCVLEDVVAGRIPLKEIADKYHFANYAHFGSFCKTRYGASPKELWRGKNTEILRGCKIKLTSGRTSQL